uniref:Dimer_Tnp_hAT domain-containing protein n=1 Tax=Rhabditophanes sp. KR3021 TaxID=114890 RepID=A0AC35UAD8_9BILA
MAKSGLIALNRKLQRNFITNKHKITLFLFPKSRKLNFLKNEEKEAAMKIVSERFNNLKVFDRNEFQNLVSSPITSVSNLMFFEEEEPATEKDEISEYINGVYPEINAVSFETFDLVAFWVKKKNQFPVLYQIAVETLCISSSSASAERSFSKLKGLL